MDIESIVKEMKHDIIYSTPGYEEQHKKYCTKCALESYANLQRDLRKGLEKLRGDINARRNWPDYLWIAEKLSAILEGKV